MCVSADVDDLVDVSDYLLALDQPQIHSLGLVLGLDHLHLKKMKTSETYLEDVVYAWLSRMDRVAEKGLPSWSALAKALRHSRVGHNGIAASIEHDKGPTE